MANDLRRFFDVRNLNDQELGMIEFVLTSPAYDMAFRPYLEEVKESMHSLWLDRSQKRKDEYPDDFLAGGVCAIEGLLKYFHAVIHEANFERVHESMAGMTNEKIYELRRQQGAVRPVVGIDQPATPAPYNRDEDF